MRRGTVGQRGKNILWALTLTRSLALYTLYLPDHAHPRSMGSLYSPLTHKTTEALRPSVVMAPCTVPLPPTGLFVPGVTEVF